MKDPNCVFCKIAAGEIPSITVYEDDFFRVIFDIAPASKGHTIILPKNHIQTIFEMGEEDACKIFVIASQVANVLKEELHCEGLNILQNNGAVAGQTVFHFHMHLIPRYTNDKVKISWKPGKLDSKEMEECAEVIYKRLM